MEKVIAKIFKMFFILLFIWFLLCQIHVIYHYVITIYRNEWIVGRTMEEIEIRYGKPKYHDNTWSFYDRPDCLSSNTLGGFFLNALLIIPFYAEKRYYIVKYDDGIAFWAGYENTYQEDFFEVY